MRAVTVCELDLDGEAKLIGEAYCSIKDVFCKEKGRKVALAKVLQNIPDRGVRRQVWNEYFNRMGAVPLGTNL